jgi:hypothetical protein
MAGKLKVPLFGTRHHAQHHQVAAVKRAATNPRQ